jgi:LmbE family N-acetylglucosaminyl deacetylase
VNLTLPTEGAGARPGASGDGPHTGPHTGPHIGLPRARGVLAVVGCPGDEAYYLGAVLDAFRAAGARVSTLVLTRGRAVLCHGGSRAAASAGAFEFEVASFVLRVTHRLMIDYPEGGLDQVPAAELVRRVTDMIRQSSADLLLTTEAGGVDPQVVETTCAAGRTAGVPVLAWTLPAGVAAEVRAAGGLGAPDQPRERPDVAMRVARKVQRRAMRAHRSRAEGDRAQLARLDVQGDREWLHWLVHPDRRAAARVS